MIRAILITASLGYGFRSLHHERATGGTKGAGRFGFDGIFALGVVGTAVKKSESSSPFGHKAGFA